MTRRVPFPLLAVSTLLTPLALLGSLAAQSMPVPDGKGRLLQLFDLDKILAGRESLDDEPAAVQEPKLTGAALPLPGHPTAPIAAARPMGNGSPHSDLGIAAFLRPFVDPPLAAGDDLQVLGGRWLALLGSPAQIASVEQVLANATTHGTRLIDVEVRIFEVKRQAFDATIKGQLQAAELHGEATWRTVLSDDAAMALQRQLERTGAMSIDSPRLLVYPLQRANMHVVNQTSYIQDFTLTRTGDTVVADPVVGIVWDGLKADLMATFLAADRIAVRCTLEIQQLLRPIPDFTTEIAKGVPPVKIQLPRTTGVRCEQVAEVKTGERVVFAAQKVDGDYLIVLMRAEAGPDAGK